MQVATRGPSKGDATVVEVAAVEVVDLATASLAATAPRSIVTMAMATSVKNSAVLIAAISSACAAGGRNWVG